MNIEEMDKEIAELRIEIRHLEEEKGIRKEQN